MTESLYYDLAPKDPMENLRWRIRCRERALIDKRFQDALYQACDKALRDTITALSPRFAIGIGKFAETRIRSAAQGLDLIIGSVAHPSPASPLANRGWAPLMDQGLTQLGVKVPGL